MIADMAGIHVPLVPTRHQIYITDRTGRDTEGADGADHRRQESTCGRPATG